MARLGDLFIHIRNGANIKQGLNDSGYPITRIETISNRIVDRNKMGYAGITDLSKYQDFVLQDGDILMSHINSETHLGKTALYEKADDEIIIHGMNLLLLRPNKNLITSKYAFYYFSSQAFLKQIPNITKKSVNQASFTVSALKELSFPEVSLIEQKIAIDNLDKVSMLIEHRKQQLSKLDELVKARFVEIFGDVNKAANTVNLESVCCGITDGSHNPPKGIDISKNYMISSQNIQDGEINYNDVRYLSDSDFYREDKRTNIRIGDVLLTIVGTVGRTAVVNDDVNITSQRSVCIIHPNSDLINSTFLKYMLDNIYPQIEKEAHGIAQKGIYLKQVKLLQVILPNMNEQIEFADFVKQIDKSKFEVQQSLEKLETLKKSLMQQYFG